MSATNFRFLIEPRLCSPAPPGRIENFHSSAICLAKARTPRTELPGAAISAAGHTTVLVWLIFRKNAFIYTNGGDVQ